MIWTNGGHLDWTILDCYFDNINHKKINTGYLATDFKVGDLLLWTYDLGPGERIWLEYRGIEVTEIYHEGLLGDNWVHLYRITSV